MPPERWAELPAGLHQPEHGVACDATIAAHRVPGDLSFGDEAAQIVLRGIGVQRDCRRSAVANSL